MELDALRQEHFAALVGEAFLLCTPDGDELELTLLQAKEIGSAALDRRAAFSVLWRGPAEPLLAQGIYPIEAPAGQGSLGRLELFVVPVGPATEPDTEGGMLYEAVFT